MKKLVFWSIFICSFCLLNGSLAEENTVQLAQLPQYPTEVSPLSNGIQGRVSLDLRNIEVVEALKFLSMKAGLNIITTKAVEGRVTLLVQDVLIQDVFDIMLRSNGLAYTKERDIYNVMSEAEYKDIFGKNFSDIRQVKVFRLKYAIPDQAFTLIDTIKSDIGRVLVEPDSGMVFLMDTPEKIKEVESALSFFEERNMLKVFDLKYAKAKDIEDQLKAQLDEKKVGSIQADERTNQVVVQTLAGRMQDIENLIVSLDKKTLEVLVDVKIIKVKLTDEFSVGVQWEGLFDTLAKGYGLSYIGSSPFSVLQPSSESFKSRKAFADSLKTSTGIGAIPFSGNTDSVNSSTKVVTGERVHVGVVNRVADFDAVINYLQTIGKTQVLSNPKLVVINNHEATIHVGEKQAYVTTTTTQGQSTSTVSEEVTFVPVGITLSLTVIINDDGFITMTVKPEISSVVSTLITPSGNSIPIIDSSEASTTVMVKDGSTVIIGGLRKEDKIRTSKQLPVLGNIPLIGLLFKSSTDKLERTEILIMLTPHVITGDLLSTGIDRDFEAEPVNEFKEYSEFTDPFVFKPEVLENKIVPKGPKEYSEFTDISEFNPSKDNETPEKETVFKGLAEPELKSYRGNSSFEGKAKKIRKKRTRKKRYKTKDLKES